MDLDSKSDGTGGGPRISLFLPCLYGGGAEMITLNLAGCLIKWGVQVDLVLGKAYGPYMDRVPCGVRIVDLGRPHVSQCLLPMVNYLRSARPAGLISALEHSNVLALVSAAIAQTGTKMAVATHVHLSAMFSRLGPWKRGCLRFLIRRMYPRAHSLIAVSRGVAEDLIRFLGCAPSAVTVLYNPVVGDEFLRKSQEDVAWPEYRISDGEPVIVAVGRLSLEKDYGCLLRALASISSRTSAKLLVLGEGSERCRLEAMRDELNLRDRVEFPGFVANPYPFMRKADVVALSSNSEALPTVLIEAMACETPVVSTDCPSGPREILADGAYGRLVPVGDHVGLGQGILDAIEGRVKPPPSASWQRFRIEVATAQYLKLFGIETESLAAVGVH